VLFLRLRSARANVSVGLKWHVIRTARVATGVRKERPFATAWRTGEFDPEPTFEVGLMNGRDARESGLRLKASVTYSAPNLLISRTMVSYWRQ
jgi:hypothetical protein